MAQEAYGAGVVKALTLGYHPFLAQFDSQLRPICTSEDCLYSDAHHDRMMAAGVPRVFLNRLYFYASILV